MTTGWLLLLLLIVSSQSVDSQSTTDDETCGEGGLLSRVLDNQQQILQLLQQHQAILNRLRKSLFPATFYRAMLAQSAVMRLHVVRLSVCLSVCL